MTDDVAKIVAELRQDHHNMRLLLDLIEREATLIYDGGSPDYDLLFDIMHYMTVYPDAVHHPKEDRIYSELRVVRPDLTAGFQRISMDHRDIAEAGRNIRDNIASIAAGNVIDRKAVVAETLRYVNNLRSHMQWEELDLFRRCLAMANEGHKFLTSEEAQERGDPLFGEKVAKSFDNLYRQIKRASRSPQGTAEEGAADEGRSGNH